MSVIPGDNYLSGETHTTLLEQPLPDGKCNRVAGNAVLGESWHDLWAGFDVCGDNDVDLIETDESRCEARKLDRCRLAADAGLDGCCNKGRRISRRG